MDIDVILPSKNFTTTTEYEPVIMLHQLRSFHTCMVAISGDALEVVALRPAGCKHAERRRRADAGALGGQNGRLHGESCVLPIARHEVYGTAEWRTHATASRPCNENLVSAS